MRPYETGRQAPSDEDLAALARDLVLDMMSCASTETITPVAWWPRAKAALLAACDQAETWGQLVTTMASKLQIDVLRVETGKAICSRRLAAEDLRAFVRVARAEAVYIVAEAAAIRSEQRVERETAAAVAKGVRIDLPGDIA
jgi:hypothetical protein